MHDLRVLSGDEVVVALLRQHCRTKINLAEESMSINNLVDPRPWRIHCVVHGPPQRARHNDQDQGRERHRCTVPSQLHIAFIVYRILADRCETLPRKRACSRKRRRRSHCRLQDRRGPPAARPLSHARDWIAYILVYSSGLP